MSSIMFLVLIVTLGNLALGFGIAVHLGFGPDWQRLAAQWRELRQAKGRKAKAEH